MFTEEISRYSGLLVCSLARGVELELTGVKDEIREKDEFSRKDCFEMNISGTDSSGVVFSGTDCSGEGFPDVSEEPGLTPVCRKCHGQIKHKGGNVEFNSIQPLFKLIGGLLIKLNTKQFYSVLIALVFILTEAKFKELEPRLFKVGLRIFKN